MPPACVGWSAAPGSTLVAVAARFKLAGGAEAIRRRIGAVSELAGLLYWSTSSQKWQPLIVSAAALAGASAEQRRADFSPTEIAEGRTLYVEQQDNLLGKAVYRLQVLRANADHLVFSTANQAAIRYLSIPVFQAGDLQSIVFLDRESPEVWRYYGLVRTGGHTEILAMGHDASLINRAVASFRYLAGIPADREPPAAR
jgi:hypothetical protein